MNTVQKIHNRFYKAEEKILAQAKAIIENPVDHAQKVYDRFAALGFAMSAKAAEAKAVIDIHKKAEETVRLIDLYRVKYPNHKFINEEMVKKICDKYGLYVGDTTSYIGGVPEKNIVQMEAFEVSTEDVRQPLFGVFTWVFHTLDGKSVMEPVVPPAKNFKICAPIKDFNMEKKKVKGHHIVPEDPIVLQPVRGGYLIVTCWGPEASDELVINQNHN